jgi:DNA-binding transcriptional MerR regulator
MGTYTIGELAGRTGFSPSSLRYYDGIGLVDPLTRTPSGYRLYGDEAVSRLAFIARAKQLGCTLDEIAELATVWQGQECGPVQRRMHQLVTEKIRDTERQIADLTVLLADLRAAADHLGGTALDAPCDADCACSTFATISRRS